MKCVKTKKWSTLFPPIAQSVKLNNIKQVNSHFRLSRWNSVFLIIFSPESFVN